MQTLDIAIWISLTALAGAFIYLIYGYTKGLKGSPREIYLLFASKIVEYAAYGAINMTFVLYLSDDCGMSDIGAGSFIGVWSMGITLTMIFVGSVCDAIGIKKTLLIGTTFLILARIVMPFTSNIAIAGIFGFIPLAIGIAITGPVLSVGIKRYTTKEGAALGFALFYTLMNVGWALGGIIFDWVRTIFGEHEIYTLPIVGSSISTYQIIFLVSFFLSIPVIIMVMMMRDHVRMTETRGYVIEPPVNHHTGTSLQVAVKSIRSAAKDTLTILGKAISEKTFWVFLGMLAVLVPVKLVFYHFHYTFPKYGIRVLGEGVKIGNLYGVLNPMLIVFLVPLFGYLTKKVSSYKMMMIGTFISAFAVFIAIIPDATFAPLMNTWAGELVFDRWLSVPEAMRQPVFFTLIAFIFVFTIGEAIWSPRLMQFTAEIAPTGREGSYIALSYLPYFLAKLIAGPMSGWLVATYTPEGASSYPNHYWVWIWIGGMAVISPILLVVFNKVFRRAEARQEEENGKT